jgi:hypothetical protein
VVMAPNRALRAFGGRRPSAPGKLASSAVQEKRG